TQTQRRATWRAIRRARTKKARSKDRALKAPPKEETEGSLDLSPNKWCQGDNRYGITITLIEACFRVVRIFTRLQRCVSDKKQINPAGFPFDRAKSDVP